MVMDANGNSHKAAGRPDGGQFDRKAGQGVDDDLTGGMAAPLLTDGEYMESTLESIRTRDSATGPMVDEDGNDRTPTPPSPPAVAASAPGGDDNTRTLSADETRGLVEKAARVEVGPDGVRLYDENGMKVFDETEDGAHLDYREARRNPKVRRAVRAVYRDDLTGMKAVARRAAMRNAWRLSGPYDRRRAIDTSPNRRYIPAGSIARSLKHRKDKEAAARELVDLFYEDADAAGNVIRAGFPDDKHSAFVFINNTKFQRYGKDVFSKTEKDGDGNPRLLHRKGDAIIGDYTSARTKRAVHGPLPNPKGAAARSYLLMLHAKTNGVPSDAEVKDVAAVFRSCADEPEVQARMLWDLSYGTGSVKNPDGDVEFAKAILGQRPSRRRGVGLLDRFSRGRGNGNAARMLAYQKVITPEAAQLFLDMKPGDGRLANTIFTRRKRGEDGLMHDVTPARLTEMRNYVHSVYEI